MNSKLRFTVKALLLSMLLLASYAVATHAQNSAPTNQPAAKKGGGVQPAVANLPVLGSGTIGRLTKWTGLTSGNSYISDSTIFESKFGQVGVGTDTPTSKLSVQGMIETTLGGYKFPDGSVQTTAALSGLQSVFHDTTLTGAGTQGSPLGVAVPLILTGSNGGRIIRAINTAVGGTGVEGRGGNTGAGIVGLGGEATNSADTPGNGVRGIGGNNIGVSGGEGGDGVAAYGGGGFVGGNGLFAAGGSGANISGVGVVTRGGSIDNGAPGFGGAGIRASGGFGFGAGKAGGPGVYAFSGDGFSGAASGPAGIFFGEVEVQGNFNVTGGGTKNFKIDHPLDPENKYLYHAAIESSEVLNIYSGNITTNENGEATVTLPDWFEAVNRDFRYQLTVVGTFAQAIVADEVKNNTFKIKTNASGVKVSWQVTGIRSDAAIRKRPFKVEEAKLQSERGYYLAPEAYDQPEERGIQWARNPQMMQQLKQQRLEAEQSRNARPEHR